LTIFTDGSCTNNGKQNAKCRGGIWITNNHPLNRAISMPSTHHFNQIGELVAVLVALQSVSPLTPVKIVTDSKYVINGLTTHLNDWEDTDWIDVSNAPLFKAIAYQLRQRPTPTSFQWVKGHSGIKGNDKADRLAQNGAAKTETNAIDTYVPRNFDLQGAKLSCITQKSAYRTLMNDTHLEYHRQTLVLLSTTRDAIETITTTLETDETIWRSCRHKDIAKKIQMFMYKTLNNAFRIGEFWLQIPTFEHRARCSTCGETSESMDHILTQCNNPTQKKIWSLAKTIWPRKHRHWPDPTIGLILGCGALSLPQPPRNRDKENQTTQKYIKGASHLLRILISESAYLIWTLRCERTIKEQTHTEDNITSRWLNTINRRLQLDRAIAARTKRSSKTTAQVLQTWADIIEINNNKTNHNNNDWVTNLEVLVGIKLPRPSQTEATR
ncbi:ribonuclease H-like protein, partial [Suillus paluster]|uniref:ribonuclease H-like protein n=1 Tax=Suillus paluster TaxID=48578 RepID=UPI001B85CB3E